MGKKGVGDAVDSFNMNATYFESKGCTVVGTLFNRLSTTGYYSLQKCREAVSSYFKQYRPDASIYGFIPEIPELVNASPAPLKPSSDDIASAVETANEAQQDALLSANERCKAELMVSTFESRVDVDAIVRDATLATINGLRSSPAPTLTSRNVDDLAEKRNQCTCFRAAKFNRKANADGAKAG